MRGCHTADDPGGLVAAAVVLGGVGALLQAGLGARAVDLNITINIGLQYPDYILDHNSTVMRIK